jgi:aryl-alcohol dehydrogenase-like predicted oxidoreductase
VGIDVVQLGRAGLRVSRICLGTMTFGAETDEAEATRIAEAALDAGAFFWDTADMYAKGRSEEIVGRVLRGRRDRVVLATKAYAPMGDGPNDRGLSARHVIAACEASLRRLQTDWIDLYYLHLPDPCTPLDETLRAMDDLRRSGKIRYIACSNFRAWESVRLLQVAERHGWQPISAIQPVYNLTNRQAEIEILPMATAHGLGAVTYSPLARGVLTGKYRWGEAPPPDSRLARKNPRLLAAEWREASMAVVDGLTAVAAARGVPLARLAQAWVLANPQVTSMIAGPRTLAQWEESAAGACLAWDPTLEAEVDRLVPPGTFTGREVPDPAYYPVTGRR